MKLSNLIKAKESREKVDVREKCLKNTFIFRQREEKKRKLRVNEVKINILFPVKYVTIIQTGNEKWSFNVNSDEWSEVDVCAASRWHIFSQGKALYMVKFLPWSMRIFSLAGGKHTEEVKWKLLQCWDRKSVV